VHEAPCSGGGARARSERRGRQRACGVPQRARGAERQGAHRGECGDARGTVQLPVAMGTTGAAAMQAPVAVRLRVMVTAVVFDVGETLVDETRDWEAAADACGVPRFTLMALVGFAIARGESHRKVREWLEIDPPRIAFLNDEFYPDAVACLRRCREADLSVGA